MLTYCIGQYFLPSDLFLTESHDFILDNLINVFVVYILVIVLFKFYYGDFIVLCVN